MPLNTFTTERLSVSNWLPVISKAVARKNLEDDLSEILTERVLAHLPPPLQLGLYNGKISAWIDALATDGDVLLIHCTQTRKLVGVMIIATDQDVNAQPTYHIGYLLAELVWGKGIASEIVAGFVQEMQGKGPLRLIGGVDKANRASKRVLEKSNFKIHADLSSSQIDMYVHDII